MALIPCTTGTYAIFQKPDGAALAVPVEAWDDVSGAPYVAGPTALVAAGTLPGFARLEQATAVIPVQESPKEPTRVPVRPRPRPVREERP